MKIYLMIGFYPLVLRMNKIAHRNTLEGDHTIPCRSSNSATAAECMPHRSAPCIDGLVALGAGRCGPHMGCGHGAPVSRQGERRPVFLALGKFHMDPLQVNSRLQPFVLA